MNTEIWKRAAELSELGRAFCFAILTQTSGSVPRRAGSVMLVTPDGTTLGTIGGGEVEKTGLEEALLAMQEGKPRLRKMKLSDLEGHGPGSICGGSLTVFLLPQPARATLHLFGAGHVARPTAHLASKVGYSVMVYDHTDEYATKKNFPEAAGFGIGNPVEQAETLVFGQCDAVVILSGSHDVDFEILQCLKNNLPLYLGVIASRKKAAHFRKKLKEEGWNEEAIKAIYAPIGLDIGSRTPEEIAVSIIAEMIKVRGPVE